MFQMRNLGVLIQYNLRIYCLQIFRPNFEEDHHNFAGIEIQAKLAESNLFIFEIDNAAY